MLTAMEQFRSRNLSFDRVPRPAEFLSTMDSQLIAHSTVDESHGCWLVDCPRLMTAQESLRISIA